MAMVFPGMDPYLEHPVLWSGVHASLIVYMRDQLQPLLRPRYIAAIEERVFVEAQRPDKVPDVWIAKGKKQNGMVAVLDADTPLRVQVPALTLHEAYLTILDRQSGQNLVTVIEVVSPTNKYAGPGRDSYLNKQQEILASKTHLVEIDLLRTGPHVLAVAEWMARGQAVYHYLACVNRAEGERDRFELYPRTLQQRLPRIAIPLADSDPDVVLDVQAALEKTYEMACYADRLEYSAPCVPPLSRKDQTWANQLLIKNKVITKGRRTPRKP